MGTVRGVVRSVWAEPAVTSPPQNGRLDKVLALTVLLAVAFEVILRADLAWRPAAVVLGFVLAVAVLVRRTHGLAAVALAFGAIIVVDVAAAALGAHPEMLYTGLVVLVLVYSLFRWGAGRDLVVGTGIVALAYIDSLVNDVNGLDEAIGGGAVLLFTMALGVAFRYRAIAGKQLVEQVKLHERAQLARELHDTIAHHVSAIAIQAQAGLVLARSASPSGATEALEVIDREAATTLTEMRAMVGALRSNRHEVTPVTPGHRLVDIERLAATGASSLRVEVEQRGDLTELPQALEAALYRVAQESVTNAQRHAQSATRVEVTVTGNATEVQLTVVDDGAPTTSRNPPGYGLIGMTERISLLGGTLQAGPAAEHGWRVRAVLPRSRRAA